MTHYELSKKNVARLINQKDNLNIGHAIEMHDWESRSLQNFKRESRWQSYFTIAPKHLPRLVANAMYTIWEDIAYTMSNVHDGKPVNFDIDMSFVKNKHIGIVYDHELNVKTLTKHVRVVLYWDSHGMLSVKTAYPILTDSVKRSQWKQYSKNHTA